MAEAVNPSTGKKQACICHTEPSCVWFECSDENTIAEFYTGGRI